MLNKLAAGLASAMVLALAAPTSAAVVEITYTGHVASGNDFTGVFGAVGSLAGAAYTATFLFDTALGQTFLNDAFLPDNGSQRAEGGPDFNPAYASPSLGSTFTIGAVTVSNSGANYGVLGSSAYETGAGSIFSDTSEFSDTALAYISKRNGNEIDSLAGLLPPLLTPFTYTVRPGDAAYGRFLVYRYDKTLNVETLWADANLSPETVTLRIPGGGAVPEPGAWTLLLVGFGVLGATLRRRQRLAA